MKKEYLSWLYSELPKLTDANVITDDQGKAIKEYYGPIEKGNGNNVIMTIFAIIGAVLIGAGIILIMAKNWDMLSPFVKTVISFIPLLLGQGLIAWTYLKKKDSPAWVESTSAFNFLTIGATISLIGQIYNVSGQFDTFMLTWILIFMPIMIIMNTSMGSILFLIAIIFWRSDVMETQYMHLLQWVLILPVVWHFYKYFKKDGWNPRTYFVGVALMGNFISGFMMNVEQSNMVGIWRVTVILVFVFLYFLGKHLNKNSNALSTPFGLVGFVGTIITSYVLTFSYAWRRDIKINTVEIINGAIVFIISLAMLVLISYWLVKFVKNKAVGEFLIGIIPFVVIILSVIQIYYDLNELPLLLMNLLILAIGILIIQEGVKYLSLMATNLGMLIVSILIVIRFFDTDLPFLLKGVSFIILGIGFLLANRWIVKRKEVEA